MYRVVSRTPLSNGLKFGDLFPADTKYVNISALLLAGVIVEASSPPLAEVPRLTAIVKRLEEKGSDIKTVKQFVEADAGEIAESLGYKSKAPVEKYQALALESIKNPEKKGK